MQTITRFKNIRISTRKARLAAGTISGLGVSKAVDVLSVVPNRGAKILKDSLSSAVANSVNNFRLEKSNLVIKSIDINEGQSLKRFRPSTRGRIHPYKKRSTNIRIVLEEKVKKEPKETTRKLEKLNPKKIVNESGKKKEEKKGEGSKLT